jgi:formylglycine-generating enzyme required for sulfatase activity
MKKATFLFLSVMILFYACSKNSPTSTPNVEQTVGAVLAETANANATQTQVAKLYTPTNTSTITVTPNMTQTIGAIITAVGAANATSTEAAQETATADAGLFTPTTASTNTETPNATLTVQAILTVVGAANATSTDQAQETATAAAGLYTPTTASTNTETPNATLTVQAILTVVGAANATSTDQAQETATAAAGLYTPTLTSTITPSPNQTSTAAAIGTIIANIHQTETAAVVATQTASAVMATQTVVAAIATQTAVAVVATQTAISAIPYTDLASVPGGIYTQTDGTNSFSHTISTFKMGKYQVTYNLWNAVYQWAVSNGYSFADAGAGSGDIPVTYVSWRDVIVWCNAYSQEAGLLPCYTYSSVVIKDSSNATACDNAVCAWANNGYRLPTEGEYQYAASYIDGSTWTPYNYASGATAANEAATDLVGWDNVNSGGTIHAVGGLAANTLGIYDMSGNIWELCWDWYGTYPTTASIDYRGPASGSVRVARGGNYADCWGAYVLQVGYRDCHGGYGLLPDTANAYGGFRFARTY